jgi:lysosomal acid lipase/cholesteryl ester hydrolase
MTSPVDIFLRWLQLLFAIAVVIIEWLCRGAITLAFRVISVPWEQERVPQTKTGESPDCERGTIEYITAKGYLAEEHFVTTPDGYILGLHRVPATNQSNDGADVGKPNEDAPRCPILMIHGFMHSSEALTIRQNIADSLPLVLSNAGYDVWLGNNRGNRYSHKHVHKKPNSDEFWDFSLDDMARYDLPTMIDYVLAQTGSPSLTLIGFSQGTAQSFAYLSNHTATPKVNLFIALAPVIVPRGFANPIVDSLARARPDFIFLLFGKRQLLPSTLFWRSYLPRARFVQLIDLALKFLFGWDTACISTQEKELLYSHIYSHASVKTVVQWFQMIQSSKFQMFDDYKSANISSYGSETYPGYVLPCYQTGQIQTPVAFFLRRSRHPAAHRRAPLVCPC